MPKENVYLFSRTVEEILRAISQAKTFDDLAQGIVETYAREFDAEVCTLWKRYTDEDGIDRLRLAAASAAKNAPQTIAQEVVYEIRKDPDGKDADGVTGYIAQTGKLVHVKSYEDLITKFYFCHQGKIDKIQWEEEPKERFKSLFAVPLRLGSKIVGVLKLENKGGSSDGFPKSDRQVLLQTVPYIAIAVHSLNLLDPYGKRLIEAPASFAEALLAPFETQRLVKQIVERTADILHAEICTLWLVNSDRRELRIEAYYGFEGPQKKFQTYRLNWDAEEDEEIDGITAWVAIKKEPFWANSWEQLQRHKSHRGKWDKIMWRDNRAFRCLYAVPLLRENEAIGVLKIENRIGAASFTDTDKVLFNIMASFIVLVLELGQRFRTSMVSDFAHIIRSPIGEVVTNLSMLWRELEKESPDRDRTEYYIELIKKAMLAVNVQSKTLSAFVSESTIAENKAENKMEAVHLRDLVKERLEQIKPFVPSKMNISIKDNLNNDVLYLSVIAQTNFNIIFDNIIHNAMKFSPPDGEIEIILKQKKDKIVLEIQDYGTGISKEDLLHIFEPGFTRRAKGHPQSSGMGLTHVSKQLKRLGWKYDIESEWKKGTKFTVLIPLTKTK